MIAVWVICTGGAYCLSMNCVSEANDTVFFFLGFGDVPLNSTVSICSCSSISLLILGFIHRQESMIGASQEDRSSGIVQYV